MPLTLSDRYRGSLLGLACGDALGTTVEFKPRGSFPDVTDMTGGGPFNLKPGQWTDDTSMALCLAESLLNKGGFNAADQMGRYLNWWQWGYLSATGDCFDIGMTVREALARFQASGDPFAGSTAPYSAGNGSLMRLAPVVLFYLLSDWPQLLQRAWDIVPPRLRGPMASFLGECDVMLGQYLRGQVLVMLALAVFYSVGLAIAGFDLALPVGIFTGLAVFIPYVGFGIGLALALLAGALQFANLYGVLAVAAVYGLGQLIESFALTPRLVGERIGLSPLMVIFALLAFGHLFGFVGVLIALPVSAVGVVAARRLRATYLDSRLFKG